MQQATAEGLRYIKEAGADEAVLQLKSLEAFAKAADGKATKIIIPSDIQGIAGLVRSLAETAKGLRMPVRAPETAPVFSLFRKILHIYTSSSIILCIILKKAGVSGSIKRKEVMR